MERNLSKLPLQVICVSFRQENKNLVSVTLSGNVGSCSHSCFNWLMYHVV